jgi:hydrogenase maturation factor
LAETHLDELPTEPYEPKKSAGFEVVTTRTDEGLTTEFRSQVFVDIIGHFNKQIKNFEDYINKATLPKLQEYIDKASKVSTNGFIVAGIVSLIGTITAVFSLFLTFEGG